VPEPDWSFATFEGARAAQTERMASLTSDERLSWLAEVLGLALEAGALERLRRERQRAVDLAWYGESS
jgi:hypothetical protein